MESFDSCFLFFFGSTFILCLFIFYISLDATFNFLWNEMERNQTYKSFRPSLPLSLAVVILAFLVNLISLFLYILYLLITSFSCLKAFRSYLLCSLAKPFTILQLSFPNFGPCASPMASFPAMQSHSLGKVCLHTSKLVNGKYSCLCMCCACYLYSWFLFSFKTHIKSYLLCGAFLLPSKIVFFSLSAPVIVSRFFC